MDQKTPGQAISEALRNLTQPFLDIHVHKKFSIEEVLEDDEFFEDEEELWQDDEELVEDDEEVVAAFPPLPSSPQVRDELGSFRACERKREKKVEVSPREEREKPFWRCLAHRGCIESIVEREERERVLSLSLSSIPRRNRSYFSKRRLN